VTLGDLGYSPISEYPQGEEVVGELYDVGQNPLLLGLVLSVFLREIEKIQYHAVLTVYIYIYTNCGMSVFTLLPIYSSDGLRLHQRRGVAL
jgi:hypothetical protein